MLRAFLKLAPVISKVGAVFHCVYDKGVFGRRNGVESIKSISRGERSNRGSSFAPESPLGQVDPLGWRPLSPGSFSHVLGRPVAVGRTYNLNHC